MSKPHTWKLNIPRGLVPPLQLTFVIRSLARPGVEVVEEYRPILALRFSDPDWLEKFFIDNIGAFRAADCHTKVIGETLLVFPKGEK